MTATLPLFYYPTNIIWIDDDELYLRAARELFGVDHKMLTFNDPVQAFKFLDNYQLPLANLAFLRDCTEHEYHGTVNHSLVDLNVPALYQIRNLPQRLQEISVIVVDYDMPQIDGMELCKQLQTLPFKKILLTGEADDRQALMAFNNNIIDRFIRKDSPQLVTEIRSALSELKSSYFCEQTSPLLSHLEAEQRSPLSDPSFIAFFQQWCETNRIVEYMLIDKYGSFVVIDDAQQQSYFIVHTDSTLATFEELNRNIAATNDYLTAIQKRELIPFFGIGKESWQFELSEWNKYFHMPDTLVGKVNYYWSHVRAEELMSRN